MAWTPEQDELIRERYPTEGASESLVRDLGLPSWKIRHRAGALRVKLDTEVLKRKKLAYNGRKFGW